MRIATLIVAALLGLLFVFAGAAMLFNLVEAPPPPEGSPLAKFFEVMASSGYLTVVKIFELVGGILVAIPATRRLGLLIIGPIIVNILIFHVCFTGGAGLADPMVIFATVAALFLVFADRRAFAAFLRGSSSTT